MSNTPVVELTNLTFGYHNNVTNIDHVSCKICQNEYVCIVGHNGSGKSTLSKIITGILKPRSGTIKILNTELSKKNVHLIRNKIGVVFQNPDNQFVGLSVEDDIAFGLENQGVDPKLMPEIINRVAKQMHIENLLHLEASILSGGQKQRVAIAGILAINPEIIIFDEATSMLDPKAKEDLKQLMLYLKNKCNKTIISITHDMEELINADRVIILRKGKIVEQGSPFEIFKNEDLVKSAFLDLPYSLKLSSELNKLKLPVSPVLAFNDLIKQITK
jgi:energy-coupling factor transport system ATP-binding protein